MLDGLLHATVSIDGDGALSLRCSIRGDGRPWDLHGINAANNRVRFARSSVGRTELLLEIDVLFRIASPNAMEDLRQVLSIWQMALRELLVLVDEIAPA